MYKRNKTHNNTKNNLQNILILGLILGSILTGNINLLGMELNRYYEIPYESYSNLASANGDSNLFEGALSPLNITDYGNLYKYNQEVQINNQQEVNLNYYLDDVHDWKASQINISINDIYDTRNWVRNSGFESPNIFRVYQEPELETSHPYSQPHNPSSVIHTIVEDHNPNYMRVHFAQLGFERYYDYLYVLDGLDQYHLITDLDNSTSRYNVYSPWIPGDTIQLTYRADNLDPYYGYRVDYYEYVNDSSNYDINSDTWGFNYVENGASGTNVYGAGECGNTTAMYVGLYGDYIDYFDFEYTKGAFSELYQNVTIPRGSIIDAYISFDYNVPFGLESNDNYIYFKINNKKVYSKGMGDIILTGKNKWHSTGKIYMDLWTNATPIFEGILSDQNFNISVGIMSGGSVEFSYFEEAFQNIVWFDNVSLVVTALANSTQSDINLRVNGLSLNDNEWGNSNKELISLWELNPITLNFTTDSPDLSFVLNTMINGYHETNSKLDQTTNEGVYYEILKNGTIMWEFLHNFFMPSFYSDFEFIISKPRDWEIISVLDPTYLPIVYEGGNSGDDFIKINKTQAKFPGWWRFKATSPNFIEERNTITSRNGLWGYNKFYSGDFAEIKTQINYSDIIPSGLDQTSVNLTIYNPQGAIWHEESRVPQPDGTITFSRFWFSSLNTTGGIYNFTLFWNNGTALGGLSSSFTVIHQSYITLLKPDDAKEDLMTGGTLGDIIPLRIFGRDFENNNSITNAMVSYNWSSGTEIMTEAALGIYETILDTGDLGSLGLYNILIQINKTGFIVSNITFTINLGEDTVLQRLDSDSEIILNANSTIKFYYYSDFDEEGIVGAIVSVNISNPSYYRVTDLLDGNYEITFSTAFITIPGVYRLQFTFYASGYEEQIHIYQFRIINPPPDNPGPDLLFLMIILLAAIIIIGVLASLSIRSYVILPRRRKRESELLARTQRFKDLSNIQAIVVINKTSGIPIFSKTYSILEKHKKELFSGFIQAITTIGEEIVGREIAKEEGELQSKPAQKERLLELDFKYFYCLISDKEDLRIVFVLKEKASQRLKEQISHLSLALTLHLSEIIERWDGSLDQFDDLVPPVLNDYIELYYKEPFIIGRTEHIAKLKKESELNSMETRIINVIYSIAKSKSEFSLDYILTSVHETNKDKVIDALETLIQKKIIIPKTN